MDESIQSQANGAGPCNKDRLFNAEGIIKTLNEREPAMSNTERGGLLSHRVFEALLIAFVTSVSVYVVSIAKIETKVDTIQTDITNIRSDIQDIRKDFYVPVSRYQYQQGPQNRATPDELQR